VRALVIEMPVLENGIAGAATAFVPLAFALRVGLPVMRFVSRLTLAIPRSHWLLDVLIDFVRRDPAGSLAILDGITFGRVAPPISQRRKIEQPTLVVGHPRDPIHPFSDADVMARELRQARMVQAESLVEWRVRPARLDAELVRFLDEVWAEPRAVVGAA
jgi:pimeloyl-ACP methyl ester carboxylesterase